MIELEVGRGGVFLVIKREEPPLRVGLSRQVVQDLAATLAAILDVPVNSKVHVEQVAPGLFLIERFEDKTGRKISLAVEILDDDGHWVRTEKPLDDPRHFLAELIQGLRLLKRK